MEQNYKFRAASLVDDGVARIESIEEREIGLLRRRQNMSQKPRQKMLAEIKRLWGGHGPTTAAAAGQITGGSWRLSLDVDTLTNE